MLLKPGQDFRFDDFELKIFEQTHLPDKILAKAAIPVSTVGIGSALDWESAVVQRSLLKIVFSVGKVLAPRLLVEPAKEIALSNGFLPTAWRISKARRRTLGSCSSKGVISFSPLLVFFPEELRRYIICHELAHLLHFNHSKDFHARCNELCLRVVGRTESYCRVQMRKIIADKESVVFTLMATR